MVPRFLRSPVRGTCASHADPDNAPAWLSYVPFFIGPSKVAPLNGPRHIASVVSCVDGEIRMGIKDGRARYPHATELRVSWLEPNENPPEKRESACDNGA